MKGHSIRGVVEDTQLIKEGTELDDLSDISITS